MPKHSLVLLIVVTLVVTGCAKHQMTMTQSGFLNNYDQLVEDKELDGMKIYRNENVDVKGKYTKIMIAPVEFMLDEKDPETQFSDEDKQKLADHFRQELETKLKEHIEITNEAGDDTLLLRAAITELLANKVYLNLHWSTTLYGAGIGGASIEVELLDSQSAERILAFVDAKKGKNLHYAKGLTKWGHTQEVLSKWAEIIVLNLRKLKGEDIVFNQRPEPEFPKP
jgi:hypothetical protein